MRGTVRYVFVICLLSVLVGCAESVGRVTVILDNSGSMARIGVPYSMIKQTLLDTLTLLPSSREVGLRVFADPGSKLIVPYQYDLHPLRTALTHLEPQGGTYIGDSLLDAAGDLMKMPQGNNRLILITDGEGDRNDIDKAHRANELLKTLQGEFRCYFILFSARQNVRDETAIGKVADILGCDLAVPDEHVSAFALATALQRIISMDFYVLWIIVSILAYLVLLMLTANLVFATQFAQGILPRHSRLMAIVFLCAMLPLVISAHIIGFLGWSSGYVWWLAILALLMVVLGSLGVGKRRYRLQPRGSNDDPFA